LKLCKIDAKSFLEIKNLTKDEFLILRIIVLSEVIPSLEWGLLLPFLERESTFWKRC